MQAEHLAADAVASISVQANGKQLAGAVVTDGSRYWISVNGIDEGPVGSRDAAIHRLAGRLRQEAGNSRNYGLLVRCERGDSWAVAFGTMQSGGRGAPLSPCLARALGGPPYETLDDALRAAVRALGSCCR